MLLGLICMAAASQNELRSWRQRILRAENAGTLKKLVASLEAKKHRNSVETCALARAVSTEESLESMGLSEAGKRPSAAEIRRKLEGAVAQESSAAYPVTTLYLWIQSHAEALGYRETLVSKSPATIRNGKGRVVWTGSVHQYEPSDSELRVLGRLYTEMTRRDPNDPEVLYIGAMRASGEQRLRYLSECVAHDGMSEFETSILSARYRTEKELNQDENAAQDLTKLKMALASRRNSVAVRAFLASEPDIAKALSGG